MELYPRIFGIKLGQRYQLVVHIVSFLAPHHAMYLHESNLVYIQDRVSFVSLAS